VRSNRRANEGVRVLRGDSKWQDMRNTLRRPLRLLYSVPPGPTAQTPFLIQRLASLHNSEHTCSHNQSQQNISYSMPYLLCRSFPEISCPPKRALPPSTPLVFIGNAPLGLCDPSRVDRRFSLPCFRASRLHQVNI
jgi:hypothetical protein